MPQVPEQQPARDYGIKSTSALLWLIMLSIQTVSLKVKKFKIYFSVIIGNCDEIN
jgi:hypothetical protein